MGSESPAATSPTERAWIRPDTQKPTQPEAAKILKFPDQKKEPLAEKGKAPILTQESEQKTESITKFRPPAESELTDQSIKAKAREETRISQLTTKLKEVTNVEAVAAKVETLWNQALEHQKWLKKAVDLMRDHRAITGALVGVAIFQLEAISNVPIPPELMARLTAGGVGAAAGYMASPEGKISSTLKGAALGLGVSEALTQTHGDQVIQKTAGKVIPFSGLGKVLGSFIDDLPLLLSTKRKVK
jgi:hypothetical protein